MKTLMGLAGLTMAGFMLLSCNTEVKEANYQIIPLPQEISVMDQDAPFILSNGTKIMYPEGNEKMQKNAEFWQVISKILPESHWLYKPVQTAKE